MPGCPPPYAQPHIDGLFGLVPLSSCIVSPLDYIRTPTRSFGRIAKYLIDRCELCSMDPLHEEIKTSSWSDQTSRPPPWGRILIIGSSSPHLLHRIWDELCHVSCFPLIFHVPCGSCVFVSLVDVWFGLVLQCSSCFPSCVHLVLGDSPSNS